MLPNCGKIANFQSVEYETGHSRGAPANGHTKKMRPLFQICAKAIQNRLPNYVSKFLEQARSIGLLTAIETGKKYHTLLIFSNSPFGSKRLHLENNTNLFYK